MSKGFICSFSTIRKTKIPFTPWTLDFDPETEITKALIWVRLTHLPFFIWEESIFKFIGDKLGRYIDHVEPKGGIFTCARICIEIDLKKGLPKAIQVNVAGWSYFQALDYEQISFKCDLCHDYEHFTRNSQSLKDSKSTPK